MDFMSFFEDYHNKVRDLDNDMIRTLSLSSTAKGVLRKFESVTKFGKYYIKAGKEFYEDFSPVQPAIESLCADIAVRLEVDCATYALAYMDGLRFGVNNKKVLVCVSPSFIQEGDEWLPFAKLMEYRKIGKKDDLYEILCREFPMFKLDFQRMIVFDYLIDNPDRHMNNFGLIADSNAGKVYFAPFFDHGLALFGDVDNISTISQKPDMIYKGKAKPFRSTHKVAINLVTDWADLGINFNTRVDEMLDLFNRYKEFISDNRLLLMKEIFRRRYVECQQKYMNSCGKTS